ncbi:MAG: T9SS type A sorting domain-containing protein [Polaribacter sp.]
MLKKLILLLLLFVVQSSVGQTRIKTMFYNLLRYDNNSYSQNKTPDLLSILNEAQPDLFLVCELQSEAGSNYLYDNAVKPFNANFSKATFQTSQSPATDLLQMAYYNSQKLILENTKVIPTGVRDINRYTFKLNTVDAATNPVRIQVYVTHLKASTDADDRLDRLESVEEFVTDLNTIPSDSFVIFAGDFNFYTSNESGYQKILSNSNPIKIIDPINRPNPVWPSGNTESYYFANRWGTARQYFYNNDTYADVHSQSTRGTQVNGEGSTGFMDDRFDYIMLSTNFTTSSDFYYVTNSYKTLGNNGNCFDESVNDTSCSGTYSQSFRNTLYNFSDHLPIYLEIESTQNTLSTENFASISFINSNISSQSITINSSEVEEIRIFNQLGQQIDRIQINQSQTEINISSYSKGVYYLRSKNSKPIKFLKI